MAKGKALVAKLRAQPGVRDAEALAASLGRVKQLRAAGVSNKKARVLAGKKGGLKEGGVKATKRKQGGESSEEESSQMKRIRKMGERLGWSKVRIDGAVERERKDERKEREARELRKSSTSTPARKPSPQASSGGSSEITGGTEKQNKFANDVRGRFESTLREAYDGVMKDPRLPEERKGASFKDFLKAQKAPQDIEKVLSIKDPKFWIEIARGREKSLAGIKDLLSDKAIEKYL